MSKFYNKRGLFLSLLLILTFSKFSFNQLVQTPVSDPNGIPVQFYNPLIDPLPPTMEYKFDKTCQFQSGNLNGLLMNPSDVDINGNYTSVGILNRGQSYNFCGQAPFGFTAKFIRIVHVNDLGQVVDVLPLYQSFATSTQYLNWAANNIKVGCLNNNIGNPISPNSPIGANNPLATKIRIEYYTSIQYDVRPFFGGTKVIGTPYKIKSIREFPLSALNPVRAALPHLELVCQKGIKEIIINNPGNHSKLYIAPFNLFSLNPETILADNSSNYTVINKSALDGKFHYFTYVDTTRQYLMSYVDPINSACGTPLIISGTPSILTILYIGNLPVVQLPPIELRDCGEALDCNLPGVNYFPLPNGNLVNDTTLNQFNNFLNGLNLTGVTLNSNSSMGANMIWRDTAYITTANGMQQVCYDDLEGPGCRTYTAQSQLNLRFNLQTSLTSTTQIPSVHVSCNKDIVKIQLCQAFPTPKPDFIIKCNPNDPICVPCVPGVDGVRFYLGPNELVDNSPEQSPPLIPAGLNHIQRYSYYHCGDSIKGTGKFEFRVESTDPYMLNERFCYNQPTGNQGLLFSEYVKYDQFGNVIKKSPVRAPIGFISMPNVQNNTEVPITIFKGLSPATTCQVGYSAVILPTTPQFLQAQIDTLLSQFNNYSIPAPGGGTIPNPFYVSLNPSYSLTTWEPQSHYSYNFNTNQNQVCYSDPNHLDPEPGSERVYNQQFNPIFTVRVPNVCEPTLSQDLNLQACSVTTGKIKVSKFMYPPKPDVHIICDMNDFYYQITQPIESAYPKYLWTPIAAASNDTFITSGLNISDATLIGDNAPSFISFQELFDHYSSTGRTVSYNVQSYNPTYNRYSSPVQITFVNPDLPVNNSFTEHFVTAPTGNPEQYGSYCTTQMPQPGTYHDLSVNASSYENTVNSILNEVANQYPGFAYASAYNVNWTPTNGYTVYTDTSGATFRRVCYGHLPETSPKSQLYSAYFIANIQTCIDISTNPIFNNGVPDTVLADGLLEEYNVDNNGHICDPKTICPVNIANQRVTELLNAPVNCNVSPAQIILAGQSGIANGVCNSSNTRTACEGDSYQLGQNIVVSPLSTNVTYAWSDPYNFPGAANSLSAYNIATPTWNYVNNVSAGNVLVYRCTITETDALGNQSISTYCEYIYQCGNCGSAITTTQISENKATELTRISSQNLYFHPNPAHNMITVQIDNVENKGSLVLWDAVGKEVFRKENVSSEGNHEISTMNLAPGLYRIGFEQNGQVLIIKNLIKE